MQSELVVETFTADLRKQKDVDCLGVFALELEAAPHVDPLLARDVPMHDAHTHSFRLPYRKNPACRPFSISIRIIVG